MQSNPIKIIILHLVAVLLTVFNLTTINIFNGSNIIPLFDVMIIFYFTVYKEGVFGLWFLFLLGIWSDALSGFPLGITSLAYIISVKFFNAINSRMEIKENFAQIFKQFGAFTFGVLFLKWIFLSIYSSNFYNIISPIIQLIISLIFYVIMHKLFDYLNQKLLDRKGA